MQGDTTTSVKWVAILGRGASVCARALRCPSCRRRHLTLSEARGDVLKGFLKAYARLNADLAGQNRILAEALTSVLAHLRDLEGPEARKLEESVRRALQHRSTKILESEKKDGP